MIGDFDPNGHKNLELFRYYLNRDLQRIDNSIQDNHGELKGYFVASLVDILIVFLFSEDLRTREIQVKIFIIAALIALFMILASIINKIAKWYYVRQIESGRKEYVVDEAKQEKIDKFDNIACDALLICESYMERYTLTEKTYVKEFYFYEIIHHLTKSADLFEEIYGNRELYISSKETELIDPYRVNNYIDFARKINEFLQIEIKKIPNDVEVQKDVDNLNTPISQWKHLKA